MAEPEKVNSNREGQRTGNDHSKKRNKNRRKQNRDEKTVSLTDAQANLLKKRPRTIQGLRDAEANKLEGQEPRQTAQHLRDAVLMTLLLDHGMRMAEAVLLKFGAFDSAFERMEFERPKADGATAGIGRHKLTPDARSALIAWKSFLGDKATADTPVLWSTGKGGSLTRPGVTAIAANTIVRALGVPQGIYREKKSPTKDGKLKTRQIGTLSAQDCRHYAAMTMAARGVHARELMHFFGWSSTDAAIRYVELSNM